MISRLPRWIESGAFVLALVAGYINAVGLMGFEHAAISHLSGTATLLGTSVLEPSWQRSLHLAGILLSFFVGAALSGFLLHGSHLKLGRHYDTALLVEGLLIFLALLLLSQGSALGHYVASAACGVQNALATTYSGAIIRTTHLTGIFTDLGLMLGAVLRGEAFDRRKSMLFLLIIAGFILGGSAGALAFGMYQFAALSVPGCICLMLALGYRIYSKKQTAIAGSNTTG